MSTWILDLGIVLLFVFFILKGYKNGFVRSVILMVGNIVAVVLAIMLGSYIAGVIYDSSVRKAIINYISQTVGDAASADISAILPGILNSMPDYLANAVSGMAGSEAELIAKIQSALTTSGQSLAVTVADTIVKPVFIVLAQSIIGLIAFIVLSIVINIVSKLFKGVNYIPVLGKANAILGAVIGILQAIIYIVIIVMLINFTITLTGNSNELINTSIIDKTLLFKNFYNFDIINFTSKI